MSVVAKAGWKVVQAIPVAPGTPHPRPESPKRFWPFCWRVRRRRHCCDGVAAALVASDRAHPFAAQQSASPHVRLGPAGGATACCRASRSRGGCSAAGRVLARHQPQGSSEVTTTLERTRVAGHCQQAAGGDQADTRNRAQALAGIIFERLLLICVSSSMIS